MSTDCPEGPSNEVDALRRRVAELERRLGQSDIERERFFAVAFDLLSTADFEGRFRHLNPRWQSVFGYAPDEMRGRPFLDFIHPDDRAMTAAQAQHMVAEGRSVTHFENRFRCKDGSYRWLDWSSTVLEEDRLIFAVARDATERKEAEALIRRQAEELRALSTPLIPINDRVLVMPLIGNLDTERAARILETLLEGVTRRSATAVILDVTGVNVIDTQVADALMRAARALGLVGARVVLTGIRPEVAQTLVMLGADLSSLITCSTLQAGIARALA
jgi:rsbT co-antagonist protein RsbR